MYRHHVYADAAKVTLVYTTQVSDRSSREARLLLRHLLTDSRSVNDRSELLGLVGIDAFNGGG